MSLSSKIQKSIVDNLGQHKDEIDEELIKFLVEESIKHGKKVDSVIIPSFQVKLNQEI